MIRFCSLLYAVLFCNSLYAVTAKPTVILLSVDGFSYNYLQEYQPKNILSFAKLGVKAQLLPVYPSKTFPNHLSIITGSYPVNHGIIHNSFYQPKLAKKYYLGAGKSNKNWLTAEPFWSVAENNSIKSAVYFWPESEAQGYTKPSYNIPYNKTTTNKARIDQLIAWLKLPADQRPHFIASYFSTIDSAGHDYGVNSPQLVNAIENFDKLFGYFIERLDKEVAQDVNLILVSDHGMTAITEQEKVLTSQVFNHLSIKDNGINITYSDTQTFIYFDKKKVSQKSQDCFEKILRENLIANRKQYSIYTKGSYPQHWHFNTNLSTVPDIILEALPPARFVWKNKSTKYHGATHGFDPKNNKNLAGIFIAAGPNIHQSRALKPFQNIHIFPFMNALLGLDENIKIDGNISVLKQVIK